MAYSSRGLKPFERASKASHGHIIKNQYLQDFLSNCEMPKTMEDLKDFNFDFQEVLDIDINPIKHIIAIDGGSTQVTVRERFPSTIITFYQFGALIFNINDLDEISESPFVNPDDISKLKEIKRFEFVLPTKNIRLKNETMISSVRKSIYEFFMRPLDDENTLMDTFSWFIYEEYGKKRESWPLSKCPGCGLSNLELKKREMTKAYTFRCPQCDMLLYLTDVFGIQNSVDEELGVGETAAIILLLEQMILVYILHTILKTSPKLLKETLFIKDGPLAFYGNSSRMYKPMRNLVNYLFDKHDLYLIGLEKSGAFVEHGLEISDLIPPRSTLLLDDDYIYKFIIPSKDNRQYPYGFRTYYSGKLIFKTKEGNIYVATLPNREPTPHPTKKDFKNLDIILLNIEKLKCNMYENALFPIALVNKLVSLSDHPSSKILKKFASDKMKNHNSIHSD
ncbi:MAG: DNA double-strand break repair nuclease NurA [Candidatus Methanofastidiosum sp.]|nr:DNA double-strand break repair nuclease NurA [Methanofastidiosum sp.]